MKRLTLDNTFEMNMHELALNQVYIGEDRWVRYRNGPEDEVSACDLIRTAAGALDVELPILSDDDLSDLMTDWLQYGAEEPEGVLAILYRALCAMAEVRAKLSRYEDTGLEPKEVSEYQHLCDSYVEAGLDSKFVQFCIDATQNGLSMNHICELAQADKDGRLVVLPEVQERDRKSFVDGLQDYFQEASFCDPSTGMFGMSEGEKELASALMNALTREEAEAALKKREEAEQIDTD